MRTKGICAICGREIPLGTEICYACEDAINQQSETREYDSTMNLIPSTVFCQRILQFFQGFFSRPEVIAAYEEYAGELSAEPALSSKEEQYDKVLMDSTA